MGRVLASRQRWIGQTASIDALNCDIGADRDFGFHRDTSAPRPDEGRGGKATRLILVLRPIWWKSEMAKLSLRSWQLEPYPNIASTAFYEYHYTVRARATLAAFTIANCP